MNPLGELIGRSPGILAVRETVGRLLQRHSDARRLPAILIQGETGTGKGLLARAIHRAGPRTNGPFVDVNCAAIPETLLEAELFGFERGAFTDARQAKAGLFQVAHRGTIFLDEVGLLPEGLQGKLLTIIEERALRRLGSTRSEPVDVWVLSATSADLLAAARARRFHDALYHRLAVLTVTLPPLRERGEDVQLLAEHFLTQACTDYGLSPKSFAPDARATLRAYRWPGNVRELANVMERVALLADGRVVTAAMLGLSEAPSTEGPELPSKGGVMSLDDEVESLERGHVLEALRQTDWNISRAAARLGIPRNTLRYRMEKHGLRSSGSRPSPPRRGPRPSRPVAPVPAPEPEPAPVGLRWERRHLTVLRAVAVAPSSAEATAELTRAFVDKVQSFGGRVEELSPAGITATFGVDPLEDAPRRAALAAIALQRAAERARDRDADVCVTKVGIHVGQFLVGRVGDSVHIDEAGKHQAWAILDELVTRADPDSVVVTEVTAPLLERRFDLEPFGDLERVQGRAYRIAGRERARFGPGGRMTRFVGRDQDLELLRSRWAFAAMGQGQVVGIVAEPGMGKSRFLFEFRRSATDRPPRYLEAHCVSYGSTIPYLPVLDMLRESCRITENDTPEAITGKACGALDAVGLAAEQGAPYLLHLLGVTAATERVEAMGPEAIKARTFDVLRQMWLKGSRQQPLVIAVEDLHWADTVSGEFFGSLAESLAGASILLLVTYRPGYRPPWLEKSYATQIALHALSPADSRTVIESLLQPRPLSPAVAEAILARAEGNPFFLEELARTVAEQGDLGGAQPLPDTIQGVVLARIDWLSPEDKDLLQAAAVIGKDVPVPLLRAVVERPEDAVRRGLLRLRTTEFLYETTLVPELEYTFKHAITHEVAYASLLDEPRRALHAGITEAIERLYPERLSEQVERLAHHSFHGQLWDKAVSYLRQAGVKALGRSAHREAVGHFEQALAALRRLPESREALEQAIELRFELRTSLLPSGEFGRILDHLRQAQALAEASADERRLGRVLAYLTDYSRQIGDHEGGLESGQRALRIAEGLGDFALQVATRTYLGQVSYDMGRYRRGSEYLRRNVEALSDELTHDRLGLPYVPAVHSRTWLVLCLSELGEFVDGLRRAQEGLEIAESVKHPFSLTSAYAGLGRLTLCRGDLPEAIAALEKGLELSREWNIRLWVPMLASSLGVAYAQAGRVADALPLLEEAVEEHRAIRGTGGQAARVSALAQAHLALGQVDEARGLATRGLELARAHRERGNEAYALRLLAEIASRTEDTDRAEATYRDAISLADDLGMRPLQAHCRLDLGGLCRRRGDQARAVEHLAAAAAAFRDMGVRLGLERSEAELRELR